MNAEDYLNRYGDAVDRVENVRREVEDLRLELDCIRSASDNDGMPHGTVKSNPTEDRAVKIADKVIELMKYQDEADEIRSECFEMIMTVGRPGSRILYERYIRLHDWQGVADETNYSLRQVFRIKDKAIELLNVTFNVIQ